MRGTCAKQDRIEIKIKIKYPSLMAAGEREKKQRIIDCELRGRGETGTKERISQHPEVRDNSMIK